VKAFLKVLIVWMTLLAGPLHGFASAMASPCATLPFAAVEQAHDMDHEMMADDGETNASAANEHHGDAGPDLDAGHHPGTHHHSAKCAACTTCGSCVAMAPSSIAALPMSASSFITTPFDQHILRSVDLALPERPPRA
jgi:hypothetical protein